MLEILDIAVYIWINVLLSVKQVGQGDLGRKKAILTLHSIFVTTSSPLK